MNKEYIFPNQNNKQLPFPYKYMYKLIYNLIFKLQFCKNSNEWMKKKSSDLPKIQGFKVARVINIKLIFTDWSFFDLIILIKYCKIWYLKSDKALLFYEKPGYVLKIENSDEVHLP